MARGDFPHDVSEYENGPELDSIRRRAVGIAEQKDFLRTLDPYELDQRRLTLYFIHVAGLRV